MDTTMRELLSLLTEDLYGPWELAIQVPVEREALGEALNDLVGKGFAEWFIRDNDSAPARALSETSERAPDLADDATWVPPALESRQILLGVTPAGEAAYYAATSTTERRDDPNGGPTE